MPKKLFLFILVPAVLLIAGYLFLRISLPQKIKTEEKSIGKIEAVDSLGGKKVSEADLRPLFLEHMQQLLKKSSNGLYELSVGDMKLDVLASTVSLQNVNVKTNKTAFNELKKAGLLPKNIFDLSFESLLIDGVNLDDALTRKTMDYRLIKLVKPVIKVYRQQGGKEKAKPDEDFSKRFLQDMTKLDIKHLVVEGGTIITHSPSGKPNRLNEVDIDMTDILLDATTRTEKNRFLFAKAAVINFSNYTTQTKDGLYTFKIGKGSIKAPQQVVSLQNISFASPLNREQFMKRQKLAKELYNLSLSSVTLENVDWWTLFNGEELTADLLHAKGGKLSIYFDRSLPLRSRMGNFPNQLLAKLDFKMNLAKFNMQNLDLSYTEFNPVSKQSGTVYMDNIVLNGTNISTVNQRPMVLNGTALFMHTVPISAGFTFNMKAPESGAFSANISALNPFDAKLMNSFTVPLGMMKIESGNLQKLTASMKGDQYKTNGNVTVLYKDLKLDLLEKDKDKKALDKKDVTSFFANLFVIKNDNPKGNKPPRQETASFQRDPKGGYIMLVWKTILVGVLKTIGAPEKLAYKKQTPAQ
ncbi:MAG: hypothetical protein EOO10_04365 [Chitinophagaceae bacterium]|nr:MAG: hypothetical protein EOO10_04365 [Chitinophagaceae bacterium]